MLTDVIEPVFIFLVTVFVGIPAVLTFADEAAILVIHAVVAPESGVATSSSTAHESHSVASYNSPDTKHALIRSIKLVREH